MGGGSRTRTTQEQTQQQTQQQVMDPEIRAAFLGNYNRAVGVANNMGVRQFADFTPDQQAAFEATRNAVGAGNQNFDAASRAMTGLLDFRPERVNPALATATQTAPAVQAQAVAAGASRVNRGDIRDISAERLRDTDLSAYMNPYTSKVIDVSLADLERSRQMQRAQDAARAAKAGAFGGSRQGVLEAETNRAFDDNAARTVAGLRSSAFENAQRAAMGDIGNQLTAQQANQNVDLGVGTTNAQLGTQASIASAGFANQANLANAAAQNQMAQFNADALNRFGLANQGALNDASRFNSQMGLQGAQFGLTAAGQLGQLGAARQAMGLQGAAALENIGGQQRDLAQARLDAARNLELERLGVINQSLGFLDPNMGATVNSSGSSRGSSTSQTRESMGLGQIAGIALQGMALMSDKRAKEDIERVGDNPAGGGMYRYRMKGTGEEQIGLLAQEVEKRDPGAVVQGDDGYKRVNYTRATGGLLDGPVVVGKRRKKKKGAK